VKRSLKKIWQNARINSMSRVPVRYPHRMYNIVEDIVFSARKYKFGEETASEAE
jgi:hypothetical protein